MNTGESLYSARFQTPDDLVKGRAVTLKCPVYLDGAIVAPTSGTVTIQKPDGTALVDAAAVTVASSTATYALSSSALDSESYGEGWLVIWALTISGVVYTFTNAASVVRSSLFPVVTDNDVFRILPVLDASDNPALTDVTDMQDFIDEAWVQIIGRIIAKGNRPNLILEPTALRNVHLFLTAALALEALAAGMSANAGLEDNAIKYHERYQAAWNDLAFNYDADEDGIPETKRKAVSSIWLCGR